MESLKDLDHCFFFWLYITDVPKITNNKDNNIKSKLFFIADDTFLIVTNPNPTYFI